MDISYELIEKKNLEDYKDLILSDIFEELTEGSESLTENYLCLGAVDSDSKKPVGCVVSELEEDTADISLLSLFVRQNFRKKKIGTTLLDKLFTCAAGSYLHTEDEEDGNVNVKTMYALPCEIQTVWESFLKRNGFSYFLKMQDVFSMDAKDLKETKAFSEAFSKEYRKPDSIKSMEELPKEEWEDLILAGGGLVSPEYTFVSGTKEERETVFLVEELRQGNYQIHFAKSSPVTTDRDWVETMKAVLHAMYETGKDFTVFMEAGNEKTRLFLEQLTGKQSNVFEQKAAWMELVFDKNFSRADSNGGTV